MAMTCTSKTAPMKKLKEHLQEQQEPFKLSAYLSERGCSMKKFSSDSENNRDSSNSRMNLKDPCSPSLKKSRILQAPRKLKSLLYKFITPNDRKQEHSSCNKAVKEKLDSKTIDMIQHIAQTNWFSAVSNITPYSASESDYGALGHGDGLLVSQVQNVRQSEEEKPWSRKEDDKQLSPVKRLQDLASGPSHSSLILTRAKAEPLFSAFELKALLKSLSENHGQVRFTEVKETVHSGSSKSQRNKMVLLKSRWLLLDCIKRAILHNVRSERHKQLHKLLSPQELGKIISEQLCTLRKQLVNTTSATQLTKLDFSSTPEEWNYFRKTKLQICREMGDSIIDQIIDEIIDLK